MNLLTSTNSLIMYNNTTTTTTIPIPDLKRDRTLLAPLLQSHYAHSAADERASYVDNKPAGQCHEICAGKSCQ
jgi:hypothetical protein